MTGDAVTIKGTSDGLVIALGEGPLEEVMSEMKTRLDASASFFVGGRVALRVAGRSLSKEQLARIGTALEESGVTLWAVQSDHPATQAAAWELGLETSLSAALSTVPVPEQILLEDLPGIVVRGTLRSGQALRHAGHITLIGDANPGSELVAGGDVIVWGKLRGTVHAGAVGNDGAVVCALQLIPSQIRIGSHIARAPAAPSGRGSRPPDPSSLREGPETARVQEQPDGAGIVVEPWDAEAQGLRGCLGTRIERWKFGVRNWTLKTLWGQR